ncbi:hypothetical protein NUW54_g14734 [Trametes sanguinea]|uniref:Uncharacterized protein n=1 Tax=Trametes sanguinea TaxID=158606 RepID=A0ACC1MBU6_9APHY|nr:hypothetical protein NUW54_g14734 [Trametes sanguinea]
MTTRADELFYTDRPRWRSLRARRLAAEQAADEESRLYEEREAENLRRESEAFLARQMDEMGGFCLGSTIVLVFEAPHAFKFDVAAGEKVEGRAEVGRPRA